MQCHANTDTDAAQQHGGNLSFIARHHPQAARPWLDLSTGINPYAYPIAATDTQWAYSLPDDAQIQLAHMAAANYYNARSLALGAGMQPLMFALACLRLKEHGVGNICIPVPSYSEHAHIWQEAGHTVLHEEIFACADVVILCNPNNPDGKTRSPAFLTQLAEQLSLTNGWLIVDESFTDLVPNISIANRVHLHPNMIAMRSFGKFFGLAGLRVSAAIAPNQMLQYLRACTGPWPVSTLASHLLPTMLQDTSWINNMRARLESESDSWRTILAQHFKLMGHTSLFTLVETPNAEKWHAQLAENGILVRKFPQKKWLRFGLPEKTQLPRVQNALNAYSL